MQWLHNRISAIEKWRDDLYANDKGAYYSYWAIIAVVGLLCTSLADYLVSQIITNLQWRWVVRGLIVLIGFAILVILFISDYRIAKIKGFQLFWCPWIFVFILLVAFLVSVGIHRKQSAQIVILINTTNSLSQNNMKLVDSNEFLKKETSNLQNQISELKNRFPPESVTDWEKEYQEYIKRGYNPQSPNEVSTAGIYAFRAGRYLDCKNHFYLIKDNESDSDWEVNYPFFAGAILIVNHDKSEFGKMLEKIKGDIIQDNKCQLNSRPGLAALIVNAGEVQKRFYELKDAKGVDYLEEIITQVKQLKEGIHAPQRSQREK